MPTVNVSPFGPKPQFLLSTGLPAVGNKLFFYVAGSVNTKQNTYTDSTGGSANTNPIVLNSLGEPTTEIWFQTGLAYKVVYAPSTDTDPPTSPIWTIDNLRGINDTSVAIDQWVASGVTPTFVSTVSFTLPGDQTSAFQVGRRIKTTNTSGTIYSYISASVFGALTTVTVVNDSGVLDSGLSAVSLGLLTPLNPSLFGKTPTVQVFTSNGTWTRPARLAGAMVMVKGGGASGGGSSTATANGGGGGEGETAWRVMPAATLGASQTVTIGALGATVAANTNATGNPGGTSSFGALLTAIGGAGGTSGNSGGTGGTGGTGGAGASWTFAGSVGHAGSDAGATVPINSAGGGTGGGFSPNVNAATSSGAGGGGGTSALASGQGGAGKIVILEYY